MEDADGRTKQIVLGGALLYCAGGLMFVFMPAYLGNIERLYGMSPADLGMLSAAELWAIALASFLGPFWIGRFNWRTLARFGALSALLGQIASLFIADYQWLLAARVATGLFGEGVLLALSYSSLGQTRNVERSFSLAYGVSIAIGMVGLYASPEIDRYLDTISVLVILAAAAAAAFAAAALIPAGPLRTSVPKGRQKSESIFASWYNLAALALVTQAIWYAGAGGFWSFTGQLAAENGVLAIDAAHAMGIGTAAALLGSFLALILNGRLGRVLPIVISTAFIMLAILAFMASRDPVPVTLELALFNMFWASGTIYVTAVTCASDDSGNIAVLVPAFQVTGMAVGTAVLGHFIGGLGAAATPWVVSGFFIVALALLFIFQSKSVRRSTLAGPQVSGSV